MQCGGNPISRSPKRFPKGVRDKYCGVRLESSEGTNYVEALVKGPYHEQTGRPLANPFVSFVPVHVRPQDQFQGLRY